MTQGKLEKESIFSEQDFLTRIIHECKSHRMSARPIKPNFLVTSSFYPPSFFLAYAPVHFLG